MDILKNQWRSTGGKSEGKDMYSFKMPHNENPTSAGFKPSWLYSLTLLDVGFSRYFNMGVGGISALGS